MSDAVQTNLPTLHTGEKKRPEVTLEQIWEKLLEIEAFIQDDDEEPGYEVKNLPQPSASTAQIGYRQTPVLRGGTNQFRGVGHGRGVPVLPDQRVRPEYDVNWTSAPRQGPMVPTIQQL